MSEFKVTPHPPSTAVIALNGRIDAQHAQMVRERLRQVVGEGYKNVVLDLSQVTFIDSSGLSTFVSLLRLVREKQGVLALASVGPQIKVALAQTKLDQVFPVFADAETAVSKLSA